MAEKAIIHNEDALAIVGELGEFDYLITDPPYPVGGNAGTRNSNGSALVQINEMMDSMAVSLVGGVLRAVKKSDRFCVWLMCDWRTLSFFGRMLEAEGLRSQQCIVWDKKHIGLGRPYRNRHELVIFASNAGAGLTTTESGPANIIQCPAVRGNSKTHVFEKPPELVEQMCKPFKPGRVLDPFCGTGGLLVGAQRLGWEVVGIDTMKEACEIARARLEEVLL